VQGSHLCLVVSHIAKGHVPPSSPGRTPSTAVSCSRSSQHSTSCRTDLLSSTLQGTTHISLVFASSDNASPSRQSTSICTPAPCVTATHLTDVNSSFDACVALAAEAARVEVPGQRMFQLRIVFFATQFQSLFQGSSQSYRPAPSRATASRCSPVAKLTNPLPSLYSQSLCDSAAARSVRAGRGQRYR
jgi:hypothetical protein